MIKFIYFDVGGVVTKDFSCSNKWVELERSLGITEDKDAAFNALFGSYEDELCCGKDVETLLPLMQNELGASFPDGYSFLHGFVSKFEKNDAITPILASIPASIKRGLLTNMYPNMLDSIYADELMPQVDWDVVIDSSVVQMSKPHPEIYEYAQKQSGVRPDEILFVDNGTKNIEAAKEAGWQTFLYDSADYVRSSEELREKIATIVV